MCHLGLVFVCVVIDFCDIRLCLGLDGDQSVFYLCEYFFLLNDSALEFTDKFPNPLVLRLIYNVHGLEVVRLVLSEHLTLAAGRLTTVFTEIVETDSVLCTFLCLLAALEY